MPSARKERAAWTSGCRHSCAGLRVAATWRSAAGCGANCWNTWRRPSTSVRGCVAAQQTLLMPLCSKVLGVSAVCQLPSETRLSPLRQTARWADRDELYALRCSGLLWGKALSLLSPQTSFTRSGWKATSVSAPSSWPQEASTPSTCRWTARGSARRRRASPWSAAWRLASPQCFLQWLLGRGFRDWGRQRGGKSGHSWDFTFSQKGTLWT